LRLPFLAAGNGQIKKGSVTAALGEKYKNVEGMEVPVSNFQKHNTKGEKMQEEKQKNARASLVSKLCSVRKQVNAVKRTKLVEYGRTKYKYAPSSEILFCVKEEIDEQGLILYPEISQSEFSGKTMQLSLNYIWVDSDTGEEMRVEWRAAGEDTDPSKAFGKALTYAEKYFLCRFFQIPTEEDDPDRGTPPRRQKPQTWPQSQQAPRRQAQPQQTQRAQQQGIAAIFPKISAEMSRVGYSKQDVRSLCRDNRLPEEGQTPGEMRKVLALLELLPGAKLENEEKGSDAALLVIDPDVYTRKFDQAEIPAAWLPKALQNKKLTGRTMALDTSTSWMSASGKQFSNMRQLLHIWEQDKSDPLRVRFALALQEKYPSQKK